MEEIGGSVHVESKPGEGTAIHMKIPLTLAIINGMVVKVGDSKYIIPTTVIRESFRAAKDRIIKNPEGREMVVVRGNAFLLSGCMKCLMSAQYYGYRGRNNCHRGKQRQHVPVCRRLIEEQQVVIKASRIHQEALGKVCRVLADARCWAMERESYSRCCRNHINRIEYCRIFS